MGARCTEQDSGLKANTTFRNVHCNRRWVQRNNLGVNHTTLFNMPVLQIIHSLKTRQYTVCMVCLNTVILYSLITNSQRIKGAKYSHPILVTRLCRNFLLDKVFSAYDRVFVAPECIMSAYNNCLHAVWTPRVQSEDIPAKCSSEELLEEEDKPDFWCQTPPTESHAFMPSIWKGMKKIFKEQIRLKK